MGNLAGGVDLTDRVAAIYLVVGGSGSFGTGADADGDTQVLSNFVVTIPEPASLSLLAGGALVLVRRRHTR